ncbi:MAG: hypothetical protein H6858_04865 [Rhodospirillales bacterium]|nr:hypothetical protein [Saprospiraceae bacterium]MCB9976916.1 hypothetical protein [Rhodospirillales bacterium]
MKKFQLQFQPEYLNQSKYGSITAPVFFDWGDRQFPELGWSDFPVDIVEWWLNALSKMILENRDEGELSFMDGPHLIRLYRTSDTNFEFVCINRVPDMASIDLIEETEFVRNVDLGVLCSELLKTAQNIVFSCEKRNYQSKELDLLRESIKHFKNIVIN